MWWQQQLKKRMGGAELNGFKGFTTQHETAVPCIVLVLLVMNHSKLSAVLAPGGAPVVCPYGRKNALLHFSLVKIQSCYLWQLMHPVQMHPMLACHGREHFRKAFVSVNTSWIDDSDDSRDTKGFESGWHNRPYCWQASSNLWKLIWKPVSTAVCKTTALPCVWQVRQASLRFSPL